MNAWWRDFWEFWRHELHLVLMAALVLLGVGGGFALASLLYAGEVHDLTVRMNEAVGRHCVWWKPDSTEAP